VAGDVLRNPEVRPQRFVLEDFLRSSGSPDPWSPLAMSVLALLVIGVPPLGRTPRSVLARARNLAVGLMCDGCSCKGPSHEVKESLMRASLIFEANRSSGSYRVEIDLGVFALGWLLRWFGL
jgi:hypothetical protein